MTGEAGDVEGGSTRFSGVTEGSAKVKADGKRQLFFEFHPQVSSQIRRAGKRLLSFAHIEDVR